jgi:hypothetical protein
MQTPHYRRLHPDARTDRDLITTIIMAGLNRLAKPDEFETYGELFKEVDFVLDLITINSEASKTP